MNIQEIKSILTSINENNYFRYIIVPLVIILLAFFISKILRGLMSRYFTRSSNFLKVDKTRFNFLKNAVSFIIYILAFVVIFYSIPQLRALGVTLFAGAGIFAAILGFASQQAFSNIISGIFIVMFKPFRVGDVVKIGTDYLGAIEDITLRHTVIRNYENSRIIMPNSVISSETIINSTITDEKVCSFLELGISYDSNVDKAIEIIRRETVKHPYFVDNRSSEAKDKNEPPVIVRVISFGDSSVNLRAYVWAKDSDSSFVMKCDLNKAIKEAFDKEGIEIPFPYRTIVYKNKKENSL